MSSSTQTALAADRTGLLQRLLLICLVIAPPLVVAVVAARAATLVFGGLIVGISFFLGIRWPLIPLLAAMALASFVNYSAGHLARDLGVLLGLLVCGAVGILARWRAGEALLGMRGGSRWVWLWCALFLFEAIHGVLVGNNVRYLLIECMAGLWPLLMLAFHRALTPSRSTGSLAIALALALAHVAFGIISLMAIRQRLGGVYFTAIPGFVAIGAWTLALWSEQKTIRAACVVAFPLLAAHVFLSFARGYWLGFLVGLAVATALGWRIFSAQRSIARGVVLGRLGSLGVAVVVGALFVTLIVGPATVFSGAANRFTSSFSVEFTGETASNVFRLIEFDTALREALGSPIIGRGLGAAIETVDPLLKTRSIQPYIHNYFILVFFKAGVIGLILFLALQVHLVRRALRVARQSPGPTERAIGVIAVAMTAQLFMISLTHYPLAEVNSAYFVAFAWAIVLAVERGMGASRNGGLATGAPGPRAAP